MPDTVPQVTSPEGDNSNPAIERYWTAAKDLEAAAVDARWGLRGLFADLDRHPYKDGGESLSRDWETFISEMDSCWSSRDGACLFPIQSVFHFRILIKVLIPFLETVAEWQEWCAQWPDWCTVAGREQHLNYTPAPLIRELWHLLRSFYCPASDRLDFPIGPMTAHDAVAVCHRLWDWCDREIARLGDDVGGNAGGENEARAIFLAEKPRPQRVKLGNWAIGCEDGDKWWLFHNVRNQWQQSGLFSELPKGRPKRLAQAFAENGGSLSRIEAVRLFAAERYGCGRSEIRKKVVTPAMNKLRTAICKAIARACDHSDHRALGDPLPFDTRSTAWRAEVCVGFAVKDNGLLCFQSK